MSKTYIGIDIGKHGAIAIINKDGSIVTHAMPLLSGDVDIQGLIHILLRYTPANTHVVFEKLGVIFGSSKQTAFSMGYQSGVVETACVAYALPYTKVRAVDWQKQMFQGVTTINKVGSSAKNTKAMALVAIQRIFPNVKLTATSRATKPHDGLIDALLMAEYARRNNL